MADPKSRDGGVYHDPKILALVEEIYGGHPPGLAEALAALEQYDLPRIQISASDGRILRLLLRAIGARRVVEFGTLSGYSALWILDALGPEGRLLTCEMDPRHARAAARVFDAAGVAERVEIVPGNAREHFDLLASRGPFDAAFIDADKTGYAAYARWAFDHLRPGGLVIADNAYLFGHLAPPPPGLDDSHAAERRAVLELHRLFAQRTSACLPTPDGLAVALVEPATRGEPR
ncbi:MAG: O-methyltransferase [Acidobacteriota bacterium]|nr:O-methyltransferase [Acidobacteriota bacterium]MDQ7088469.1 O-methyltransferase [Acidobacteriota bacterium]